MTNASGIQDPNGAISLWSALLWIEWMIGGATQRPIRLRGKSGTGEAPRKRRTCPLGRTILHQRRLLPRACRIESGNGFSERLRLDDPGFGEFRRAQF